MRDPFAGKGTPAIEAPNSIFRLMPSNVEAERQVISCVLQDVKLLERAINSLNPDWFYMPVCRLLFESACKLYEDGKPTEPALFADHLKRAGLIDKIGGTAELLEYYTSATDPAHYDFWLASVKEKYKLRSVIEVCNESIADAYDSEEDADSLTERVEQRLLELSEDGKAEAQPTMRQQVLGAVEAIEAMYENRGKPQGLTMGLVDVDKLINGMRAADLIIIAARPSMGKTSLGMNIAEHVACDLKKPTAVFSLEMTAEDLTTRMLCSMGRVNAQNLRSGQPKKSDFPRLLQAATALAEAPLFIDETPALTINQLRSKARALKRKEDIQLIVLDYLQLMTGSDRKVDRQQEISNISAGIKALAKELKIPILVMAQLNRNPEARAGGRPRISDLRESGSIEQDADVVALLMRPERYAEDEEAAEELEGEATLIIAKQRNGPTGDVPLTFIGSQMRFCNRSNETQ